MLCSECNKTVRPVVAVDIDGTLGDFHRHFMTFAVGYLQGRTPLNPPQYTGIRSMRDWFCEEFHVHTDTWYDIKLAYRQGGMKRTMPSYGYGKRLTKLVHEAGAEVWVTTTRPYLRLDNIDPDTRFWLSNNGIQFDGLIYDEFKYKLLLDNVGDGRVVAVLEDLPDEWEDAASIFGADVPILYMAAHNTYFWEQIPREQRVHDGEMAWRRIQARILDWEPSHVHH
jgi:hypothetical protein